MRNHYSIHIAAVGGYTIKQIKEICKRYGYKYICKNYSIYVGHQSIVVDGDWSDEARKYAFERELFARG
jgi:hypothetical protein